MLLQHWFLQDRTFKVPRTVTAARLSTPAPYADPVSATLCRLFTSLLRQDLNVYAYDATTGACCSHATATCVITVIGMCTAIASGSVEWQSVCSVRTLVLICFIQRSSTQCSHSFRASTGLQLLLVVALCSAVAVLFPPCTLLLRCV
jgi:Middle or third domain of peptidase_M16